jgi:hypothetical protein
MLANFEWQIPVKRPAGGTAFALALATVLLKFPAECCIAMSAAKRTTGRTAGTVPLARR